MEDLPVHVPGKHYYDLQYSMHLLADLTPADDEDTIPLTAQQESLQAARARVQSGRPIRARVVRYSLPRRRAALEEPRLGAGVGRSKDVRLLAWRVDGRASGDPEGTG